VSEFLRRELVSESLYTRFRGFYLHVPCKYACILDDPVLDQILAGTQHHSLSLRGRMSLVCQYRLESGLKLHVKRWVPRRTHHRLKILGRPSKIDQEASQYMHFQRAGLPVADFVFSGVRRVFGRRGIYLSGVLGTRTVENSEDLRTLRYRKAAPWINGRNNCTTEVLEKLGNLLGWVHHAGLVHGDFMLKNILWCPGDSLFPYRIIDLSSGWSMRAGEANLPSRTRDLVRFVCSLARNGMGLPEVRFFLKTYSRAWDTTNSVELSEELFRLCVSTKDRKAREAARLLGIN